MDSILKSVGEFGRFQYKIVFTIGLISALTSACIYATVFIAAEPGFICNKANRTTNTDESAGTCDIWTQLSSGLHNISNNSSNFTCYFDKHYYDKTIIIDFNLVCDRKYLAGLTQTGHILGATFGFCGGIFGDKYGRRKSTLLFSLLLTLCLVLTQILLDINSLSINVRYAIFSASQFLIGLLVNCVYCTAYVLLMEFTTEEYKTKIANLNSYMYVLGELIVAIVYYFSRDWNILCWFIAFYSFVLLVLAYFILQESPAWLISANRNVEALKVLKQMAKANGKKDFLPKNLNLDNFQLKVVTIENAKSHEFLDKIEKKTGENKDLVSFKSQCMLLKSIFSPKKNLIKTSLLFYVWISLMLLYYGISLGVTNVDLVDPYLMYFLSAFAELLGYVSCYLNDFTGRKNTLTGYFVITGVVYCVIAYLSLDDTGHFCSKAVVLLVLSLCGKCAISGAYNLIYIYTSELYPASERNTVLLFLVCFGGTSSMVSPQINMLKSLFWNPLPYVVYSICSFITCVCIWFLPDTYSS